MSTKLTFESKEQFIKRNLKLAGEKYQANTIQLSQLNTGDLLALKGNTPTENNELNILIYIDSCADLPKTIQECLCITRGNGRQYNQDTARVMFYDTDQNSWVFGAVNADVLQLVDNDMFERSTSEKMIELYKQAIHELITYKNYKPKVGEYVIHLDCLNDMTIFLIIEHGNFGCSSGMAADIRDLRAIKLEDQENPDSDAYVTCIMSSWALKPYNP